MNDESSSRHKKIRLPLGDWIFFFQKKGLETERRPEYLEGKQTGRLFSLGGGQK